MVLVVRGVLGILEVPVHLLHHRQFLCQSERGGGGCREERERERESERERERCK